MGGLVAHPLIKSEMTTENGSRLHRKECGMVGMRVSDSAHYQSLVCQNYRCWNNATTRFGNSQDFVFFARKAGKQVKKCLFKTSPAQINEENFRLSACDFPRLVCRSSRPIQPETDQFKSV
jgi:hypothetical protein